MHFSFDTKTGKLYISKPLGVALILSVILAVVASGYFMFTFFTKSDRLFAPEENFSALTDLNLKPEDATDSAKVAEAIQSKIQDEHKDKLTIIFFYDGYTDQKKAAADVEVLKNALKLVEPFKSTPDLLAFKTLTTNGQRCHTEGTPPVLVCDTELLESFRKLGIGNIKVVILSPLEFNSTAQYARGMNSWMTLSSFQGTLDDAGMKRWLGILFMQNLGKSLGLKAEFSDPKSEYFKESLATFEKASGRPNCAPDQKTAAEWWGSYVTAASDSAAISYFPGCAGSSSYLYPEKNTLMSEDPAKESYGKVSEDYLRGILYCFYGNKESISFPAGKKPVSPLYASCASFKKQFPKFWEE